MATPQDRLSSIAGLFDPPSSAPPVRVSRERVSASAPPRTSVNPQLDSFVNDVITEASKRTGYTYRLGSGVRSSQEQAEKVAEGYSKTYDSRHLSGNARDVLAFDSSGRYITDGSHAAYKALGDVYREKAPSASLSVKWGGDFQSFHDPISRFRASFRLLLRVMIGLARSLISSTLRSRIISTRSKTSLTSRMTATWCGSALIQMRLRLGQRRCPLVRPSTCRLRKEERREMSTMHSRRVRALTLRRPCL